MIEIYLQLRLYVKGKKTTPRGAAPDGWSIFLGGFNSTDCFYFTFG